MIRVPKQFNGMFITRHFFPEYLKYNNVRGINGGRCYDWAYYAYRLFEGVQLWTTDFHAWVQVGRKHHDSETGRFGVTNFMELGCNRRNAYPVPWDGQAPVRMEVCRFKEFWDKHGGGFKRHWDSMLEAKLKQILGKRYQESSPILLQPKPAMAIP